MAQELPLTEQKVNLHTVVWFSFSQQGGETSLKFLHIVTAGGAEASATEVNN